jgi:3'(2'),5'-bisphosphate nucleotidase
VQGRIKVAVKDYQHELGIASALAYEAGKVVLAHYRAGTSVEFKAGGEPVTVADRTADAVIMAGLRDAFPADGQLSEESEEDRSRLEKQRVWIVDPLDGTKDFVKQTGEFAVQIALAVSGYPVLGVVYQPTEGTLFHAVQDRGAFQVVDGETSQLRVSEEGTPARMCLVTSRSHPSPFVDRARRTLGISGAQQQGSVGLKVSTVAKGVCDLYLATAISKEWDICAPHALLLEAGGQLTNLCGEPIVYNRPDATECTGLIASNGLAHSEIVEALAPLLDGTGGAQ